MKIKKTFYILFLLFTSQIIFSQKKITIELKDLNLSESIKKLGKEGNLNLFYEETWLNEYEELKINEFFNDETLDVIFDSILKETLLNYHIKDNTIILTKNRAIFSDFEQLNNVNDSLSSIISKNEITSIASKISNEEFNQNLKRITLGKQNFRNLKKVKLNGKFINENTNSSIEGIVIETSNSSTYSNNIGEFSIELNIGKNIVTIKSVNYEKVTYEITIYNNSEYIFKLKEKINYLNGLVITRNQNQNIKSTSTGKITYTSEEIKNIPMVLGERDIIKVTTIMPGFKNTGEGSSGINVRGGRTDQNLFLLDKATIYNPTHLFGLFSSVNPYIVKSVNVYKSSIPTEYGGRLSSVFDISTKNKIDTIYNGEGSIGPVTANLMFKTPILNKKSDLMIAGRSSYSDWILKSLDNKNLKNSKAFFYDIYTKYSHQIDDDNQINISGYLSQDKFSLTRDSLNTYQNAFFALNWSKKINQKNNLSTYFSSSKYKFDLTYNSIFNDSFKYKYYINQNEIGIKLDNNKNEKIKFSYGFNTKFYNINPGESNPLDNGSILEKIRLQNEKGLESAIFASSILDLNENFVINAGFRFSNFIALGNREVKFYDSLLPRDENSVIEIKKFKNNEIIESFFGFEPRISLRYSLNKNLSIKGSYDKTYQYVHLLSSNTTQSPLDTWKTSDNNIKPQNADQFSIGLYSNLFKSEYELSLETYYKKINNILDYKTGANLFLNQNIETELLNGTGKAYGVELLIKKPLGKLNGFIGYTYSRTFVKVQSQFSQEQVNNGTYYPANFDKPHDLSLVLNYKFTRRYSVSMNFNYQTGRPITYPTGKYEFGGAEYTLYSDRNAFRIPDYYRMDIGFNMEGSHKLKKLAHSFWNFSIYNVLGRNNPYSIYFINENGKVNGYKTSIFSIPIPTITYNFKF